MAQAFFERYAPPDIRAESAGQEPAEAIWPNVVEAMHQVGIDISKRRPKKLDVEMQLHAYWAITLACGGACPYVPTIVEDWEIPDPAEKGLEEVREIRDLLEERVREFVEQRLEAIRADHTAHQLRLARLLPNLIEEFEGIRSPEVIRGCADAILAEFDGAPVRSFVLTLADRRTRECLREEHCAVLES
jgi:protein-tyrosine-phosphatase